MAERSVNLPLGMDEVLEAVCRRIKEEFAKNCQFNRTNACDWFRAKAKVEITYHDCGRDTTGEVIATAEALDEKGNAIKPAADEDPDDIHLLERELAMEPMPPNQVRLESDQAVPVATTDVRGKTDIKKVKYRQPGMLEGDRK